jgi:hypothetical protein
MRIVRVTLVGMLMVNNLGLLLVKLQTPPFIGSQYMMISAICVKCCMRFSTGCVVAKEHIRG